MFNFKSRPQHDDYYTALKIIFDVHLKTEKVAYKSMEEFFLCTRAYIYRAKKQGVHRQAFLSASLNICCST